MQGELRINIGAITVAIDAPQEDLGRLLERYWPFQVSDEPHYRLAAQPSRFDQSIAAPLERTRLRERDSVVQIDDPLLFQLSLSLRERSGMIEYEALHPGEQVQPSGLHSSLIALYSALLPNHDALMVHGSAFASRGRGVLVVAPSGGGKSTLASAWSTRERLSDEMVVVRQDREQPLLFPTPFDGDLPATRSNPSPWQLGLVPEKDPRVTSTQPIATREALFRLSRCIVVPRGSRSLDERCWQLACEAAASIAWRRIRFTREQRAIRRAIESALGEGR